MTSSEYVNIGLAVLAVIILLFLIGSYYNSSYDDQPDNESGHRHNRDPRNHRGRDDNGDNYHERQHKRRETFRSNQPLASHPIGHNERFRKVETGPIDTSLGDNRVEAPIEATHHQVKAPVHLGNNQVDLSVQPQKAPILRKRQTVENKLPMDPYPKDNLSANDLLPKDDDTHNTWNSSCPKVNGSLENKNFLEAGYHIGVNTIGQTLRNPNLQLRSEPPNPQIKVSPWQQSTIDPDINRRAMEIGSC